MTINEDWKLMPFDDTKYKREPNRFSPEDIEYISKSYKSYKYDFTPVMDSLGNSEEGHWMEASVKWDGCITLSKATNDPFCEHYGFTDRCNGLDDNIHICDLDKYIEDLIKLRKTIKETFPKYEQYND